MALHAQPPVNDACLNAIPIPVANDGYGTGVYDMDPVVIANATAQPGEYFAYAPLLAARSVWYSLSLPTARFVNIQINTSGIVNNNDVGFTCYRVASTSSCLPGFAEMQASAFTPMQSAGSATQISCLPQGNFLIQVSANAGVTPGGTVTLTVTVEDPPNTFPYDFMATPMDLGALPDLNTVNIPFNIQCFSIESEDEVCNGDTTYTKSAWATFTTPDDLQWLRFYTPYWSGASFRYSILEGNIATTPLTDLVPIVDCTAPQFNYSYWDNYICELQSNTTYTLHVLYPQTYTGTHSFQVMAKSAPPTNSPFPTTASVTAPNQFGNIAPSTAGTMLTRSDALSCNAFMSDNACGTLNSDTAQYVSGSNTPYPLATYFTFALDEVANVVINATNIHTTSPAVRLRLFDGDVEVDCDALHLEDDLLAQANHYLNYPCLPAGEYTIQVTGAFSETYPYSVSYNMLGFPIDVTLTATALPTTAFGLTAPGEVDLINGMNALLNDVPYLAEPDTFSCANAPRPDALACNLTLPKAIYRQFMIGDADGDNVPDSGMVRITNFRIAHNIPLLGWQNVRATLFAGNAHALATAQGIWNYPETFSGLEPMTGCNVFNDNNTNSGYHTYEGCHTPGLFTHVMFGDSLLIGQSTQPTYEFKKVSNLYGDPSSPHDLGDLIANGMSASSTDRFTCVNNADTIAGYAPCGPKAVYREFYLSQSAAVAISLTWYNHSGYRLFSGRASDGLSSLAPNPLNTSCVSSINATECNPLPEGWYTVVVYGNGPGYENNLVWQEQYPGFYWYDSDIDEEHTLSVTVDTTVVPGPLYNKPFKACVANNGDPIDLVNNGTPANPYYERRFTLCTENFKLVVDTPLVNPAWSFCPNVEKVAYYVFNIAQESYIRVEGVQAMEKFLFDFDVRVDSMLLETATPLGNCDLEGNHLEVCRLQPGWYTLVLGGGANLACQSRTPVLIVDRVEYSLYDYAINAYDFGMLPPDDQFHNGAAGDVNTVYPGAWPSADMIYCTTGAFDSDPYGDGWGCWNNSNTDEVYPTEPNNVYYTDPGTQTRPTRNLWYTMVASGPGSLTVEVTSPTQSVNPNMAGNAFQPFFALYLSDADGSLPFSDLVTTGQVDSTLAQGLTHLGNNNTSWCWLNTSVTRSFLDDVCSTDTIHRRFYVVVYGNEPNLMVQVRMRWTPYVNASSASLYDHFQNANVIGSGQVGGPYTPTPLAQGGSYSGGWDSFLCASVASTDDANGQLPNCTEATLWYSFSIDVTSRVFIARQREDSAYTSGTSTNAFRLFRELVPGDSSTATGMEQLSHVESGNPGIGVSTLGYCLAPGTYHVMLHTCTSADTLLYRPRVWVLDNPGDFCSNPHSLTMPGNGSYQLTGTINCHTIGTDYGEDGSDMGCLPGPEDWKSTWFFFEYTGSDTVDITFSYTNQSNATQVARRVFYGEDCASMVSGECNGNFISEDVISCVDSGAGSFYIQVLTPESATGQVQVNLSIQPNTNPDCIVFDPTVLTAGFTYVKDCESDTVHFFNTSTAGPSVVYTWDFGAPGMSSSETDPSVVYPQGMGTQTYDVTLTVTNTASGTSESFTQPISFDFELPFVDLGPDTALCAVQPYALTLDATQTSTIASYYWQDGSSDPTYTATASGTYSVTISIGLCSYTDQVTIVFTEQPEVDLGADITACTLGGVELDATQPIAASYLWSTGSNGATLQLPGEGTYWVQVTNGSCLASDTLVATIETLVFPSFMDTTVCYGTIFTLIDGTTADSTGTYEVLLPGSVQAGCDSMVVTNLTVLPLNQNLWQVAGCQSYTLPDSTTVLASGTHTLTYTDAYGCDSLAIFEVTVHPLAQSTQDVMICNGTQHLLPDGTIADSTGTYTSLLVGAAATGCDSLVTTNLLVLDPIASGFAVTACNLFTLPDNAPVTTSGVYTVNLVSAFGCDSLVTIDVTIIPPVPSTVDTTICNGTSLTLPDGTNADASGIYTVLLEGAAASGCDSLVTVNLTVLAPITNTMAITACTEHTLPDGSVTTSSGSYPFTFSSAYGCDSLVTYDLTVIPVAEGSLQATICNGDTFILPDGQPASTTGVYQAPLPGLAASGCDSLVVVDLTVLPPIGSSSTTQICQGDSLMLPDGTFVATSGSFPVTFLTALGCDSLVITNLTVLPTYAVTQNAQICSYETYSLPDGTQVNSAGTYPTMLTSSTGCDSLVTTNLSVVPELLSEQTALVCFGETFTLPDGSIASTSGTYPVTITASQGCDSLVTTFLTVLPELYSTQTAQVCSGPGFMLPNGTMVYASGSFPVTIPSVDGCDSLVTTILTVDPPITHALEVRICYGYTHILQDGSVVGQPGSYTVSLMTPEGCDSLVTTNLSVDPPITSTQAVTICPYEGFELPDGTVVFDDGAYPVNLVGAAADGCDSLVTTVITVDRPMADFRMPDQISVGDPVAWFTNTSQGAISYWWDFGDGNSSEELHPVHTYQDIMGGTYQVCLIATSIHQCSDTLCLDLDMEDGSVHVPNAFSPDGDGINDVFLPVFANDLPISFTMEVFDRWGQPVFSTNDPMQGWDGRSANGTEAPLGVYVWKIRARYASIAEHRDLMGHVTLLR